MERGPVVEAPQGLPSGIEHLLARQPVKEAAEHDAEIGARGEALGAGVGGTARFDQAFRQHGRADRGRGREGHRHRGQAHDRPVAAGARGRVAGGSRVARPAESLERAPRGDADVEERVR